mgnify:CR=1 FL=1
MNKEVLHRCAAPPFLYSEKELHPFDQIGLFPGPDLPVGDLQDVFFADVDDLGAVVLPLPLDSHAVTHVDMAVEEIFGAIGVQELQEALEAHVGGVVAVAHAPGRRMGYHNVHAAGPPQLEAQLARQMAMLEDMRANGRSSAKIKAVEDLVRLTRRRLERLENADYEESIETVTQIGE